ncbi:hypothetical protein E8E14_002367 [Neopestalotiopsis sp. 37M]|nr:hypothetical protein E8E14_002367 [Neopestalotiopsis sp. 37M]
MDECSIQPTHPDDYAEEPVFVEDDNGVWHPVGFSPPAEHDRFEANEGQAVEKTESGKTLEILEKEIRELKQQNDGLIEALKELEHDNEELKKELEEADEEHKKHKKKVERTAEEKDQLTQRNGELIEQYVELHHVNERLEQDNANLRRRDQDSCREIVLLQDLQGQTSEELKKKDQELKNMDKELKNKEAQQATTERQLQALIAKTKQQKHELEQNERTKAKSGDINNAKEARILELEAQILELEARILELEALCEAQRVELESNKKSHDKNE